MTKVKICGITELEDARLAADARRVGGRADLLARQPARAARPTPPRRSAPRCTARREVAGVFVNATLDEVALAADRFGLSLLQLHGDEGPAYCREAARRTGAEVMKAARGEATPPRCATSSAFHTDFHLLDANVPGHARRHRARPSAGSWPKAHRGAVPLVLSGGLTPDNVGEAIARGAPVRGGHRQRHRGRARAQGPGQAGGVLPRRGGRRARARDRMSAPEQPSASASSAPTAAASCPRR